MSNQFVRILCDVHCDWEGLAPVYRVYVGDELFAERQWIRPDCYLEELIQISAPPGKYQIHYELVPPHLAKILVTNMRVEYGSAHVIKNSILRIHDESQ